MGLSAGALKKSASNQGTKQARLSAEIAAVPAHASYTELLAKLNDIRALPLVAVRVNELINDPTSSSSDIAEVLKKDQVLTAKVLRLVNSAYYAIPGGVADVQRALAFLGFNTLAQMVLGLSVFSFFSDVENQEFSILDFWRHAIATGVCSEIVAKRLKFSKPEEAFTCGLLHDVGKLVLNEIAPETLFMIVRETERRKSSFFDVEREKEIPGHSYLGEVIAAKWGLPLLIRQVIRYHHHDVSKMGTLLPSVKPVIQVVRLANTLCVKNRHGRSGDCSEGKITSDMLIPLKLSSADIPEIEEELAGSMEKAGAFLHAVR